jgi:glycosyltransferase involved in cell wall biosynthesis
VKREVLASLRSRGNAVALNDLYVLHTIASLGRLAGGPSSTVPALCEGINEIRGVADCEILAGRDRHFGDNIQSSKIVINEMQEGRFGRWLDKLNALTVGKSNVEIILHEHGQWRTSNRATSSFARQACIPKVVSPRGMLRPWAFAHKAVRKRIAWSLYARQDLFSASVVHATCHAEASEIHALGYKGPVAVIPNGVTVWESEEFIEKKPQVLFLGRIHRVKGLDLLIRAWNNMHTDGWTLIIAGPDEENLLGQLKIDALKNVAYVGEVRAEKKWRLLSESSVCVLPTRTENFGLSIAESLMARTPVITTHAAPWESIQANGCGWWVPVELGAIEDALSRAMATDAATLRTMGERGRAHVVRDYSWDNVCRQMCDVYRWLYRGTDRPDCIIN